MKAVRINTTFRYLFYRSASVSRGGRRYGTLAASSCSRTAYHARSGGGSYIRNRMLMGRTDSGTAGDVRRYTTSSTQFRGHHVALSISKGSKGYL